MNTIHPILAEASVGISALKKNPMAVIEHAEGSPVAILNRNRPVFYAVPAAAWEAILDKIEDLELAALVRERDGEAEIEIDINEL
ncbi:MAG: type II toxin-antitoxin system Phd/YefM family antitoxin [Halieaceae bacterium]|nr:type II toxin-antitoxin system Phd/YefM family antitoxin [Halieaceae bacterium]